MVKAPNLVAMSRAEFRELNKSARGGEDMDNDMRKLGFTVHDFDIRAAMLAQEAKGR